ncbi:TRANSFORMER-2-RELATED [Salix koriyanagi]|uniref:TRANSFORMER-2-RELATED n=1 Tax=Salix koriyanagi TaxID=2511006 RepID=A0A9Q1ANG0_9ROSI|nr:TRANSFORMER-2-RELATED [Salix koriyanagi]
MSGYPETSACFFSLYIVKSFSLLHACSADLKKKKRLGSASVFKETGISLNYLLCLTPEGRGTLFRLHHTGETAGPYRGQDPEVGQGAHQGTWKILHFAAEGTVIDVHLVVDPLTRESRGFGFVTMSTVKEADRCIKYLDRSVLEGRVITVEKAKRRRGRTPTPGRYLGLRTIRGHRRIPSHSPRRSPSYSPYRRSWSRSPCYSSERSRSRSYSPHNHRRRRDRSNSPYYSRHRSPDDRYYRGAQRSSRRSYSRSISPRPRSSRRSYSPSVSPAPRRSSRRSYSRSVSPRPRKNTRIGHSRDSYSRSSCSTSPTSRSVSRSVTPSSGSPSR